MPAQILTAPLSGLIVALTDVPDPAFAAGWLGAGIAIDPLDDRLRAPCDGVVTRVAGAGNAVEILSTGGARVLLHVGIDSHRAGCFAPAVAVNDHVTAGQTLIRFDPAELAGYLRFLIVKMVVTNAAEVGGVTQLASEASVRAGAPLLRLARRVLQPATAEAAGSDQCV